MTPRVESVVPGSPACLAGLRAGDVIVAVGSVCVSSLAREQLLPLLSGEPDPGFVGSAPPCSGACTPCSRVPFFLFSRQHGRWYCSEPSAVRRPTSGPSGTWSAAG
eukprot:2561475-Rhodomonas_salina.1